MTWRVISARLWVKDALVDALQDQKTEFYKAGAEHTLPATYFMSDI